MEDQQLSDQQEGNKPQKQPAFNVPMVIVALICALTALHMLRSFVFSPEDDRDLLFGLAFFPMRFDATLMQQYPDVFSGGMFGAVLTSITYSVLHADWLHLIVNAFWMLIFGSALARRFGAFRFLLLSVLGAMAGAFVHLIFNFGSIVPVVGASAAISAHMAAAARFAFVPYGPLGRPRSDHPGAYFLPSLSVKEMLQNTQVLSFLGVWLVINLIFGLGSGVVGEGQSVAWQAHIGGLLAGLFLFPLLDPSKNAGRDGSETP